jgi:DNA-binding SARP family transcriptional activator/tetratricopeptide (TPR) repeat protein
VEFEVLGPVRVLRDGEAVALGGVMRQGLLGLLLARANESVAVDALVEALWGGEPEERHVPRLHMHVSKLRKTLGVPDRLTFDAGAYSLKVLPDELDSHRFDSMVGEATSISGSDPQRGVELLRTALGLWRGDAYQGLDFADLHGPVQRLVERRLVAYEELMTAELACDRHTHIVGELQELVRAHPFRERFHALLVTALYRGGRQADALAAYRAARQTLVDELGLEPGPELQAIEHQILAGEPIDLGGSDGTVGRKELVPAQLPPEARFFVGRAAEIAALNRLAEADGSVMVVSALAGTAGVGKTALAVRWAHQVRDRFDDGQLYVDLRGYGPDDPVTPTDALASFLRALGIDGAAIPHELAERSARFRSMVDGRRMLIVLDNARSAEQVRPLLPGTSSCFVLVTSRDALAGLVTREGAHRIDLDRMTEGEAGRLLTQALDEPGGLDPRATAQLVERCARLPLALRIVAERIRDRGPASLTNLVAELSDERIRLDLMEAGDDVHTAIRTVFSWSYQQLPPDTARLFRLSGLHPGHDLDRYALMALAGSADGGTTRRQLDTLVRRYLIDSTDAGRFRSHDLLRAYAAELAGQTDTAEERRAALTRLFDYYTRAAAAAMDVAYPYERDRRPRLPQPDAAMALPPLATPQQATTWLQTELSNLVATARHATESGRHETVVAVSGVLRRHLFIRGHHSEGEALHQAARRAARASGDQFGEMLALCGLADSLRFQGRHEVAHDYYEQSALIAHEIGDRAGEVDAVCGLAHASWEAGGNELAFDHFDRALRIACDSGDRAGEANALSGLGKINVVVDRYEPALDHYTRALNLARALGNEVNVALVLNGLGQVSWLLGRNDAAAEHYQEALRVAQQVGAYSSELGALRGLGKVYELRGDYDLALKYYERALAVARRSGYRLGEVGVAIGLGNVRCLLGDHEAAKGHFDEVLSRADQVGNPNWRYEARQGMGRVSLACGHSSEALDHHEAALEVATGLGQLGDQARAHDGLAHAHRALAQHDSARRHWTAAIDTLASLGNPIAGERGVTVPAIRAHLADLELRTSVGELNSDR